MNSLWSALAELLNFVADNCQDENEVKVGDMIDWESDGILMNAEPMRVREILDEWVFVEGSLTGIPIDQVVRK